MTRDEMNLTVCAIISTLAEGDTSLPVSESILYLGSGVNMHTWEVLRHLLLSGGVVTIENHGVLLTEKGLDMAEKIRQFETA